jgi:hypothetical protein
MVGSPFSWSYRKNPPGTEGIQGVASGKNLHPTGPSGSLNCDTVATLRCQWLSIRAIVTRLGLGVARVVRTCGSFQKFVVAKHAQYYWLMLAENHLTRRLFASMA